MTFGRSQAGNGNFFGCCFGRNFIQSQLIEALVTHLSTGDSRRYSLMFCNIVNFSGSGLEPVSGWFKFDIIF